MNDKTIKLGDIWTERGHTIAFSWGNKQDIRLSCRTRFDGNGNSIVRFIVTNGDKETSYEKYDSAAGAYEMLVKKNQ